jgi:hypothetical protein
MGGVGRGLRRVAHGRRGSRNGCTWLEGVGAGLHMVGGGLGRVAHGRRGLQKECTWSEGVQKGRRGVGKAVESSQGVSEVLGAGPGRDGS